VASKLLSYGYLDVGALVCGCVLAEGVPIYPLIFAGLVGALIGVLEGFFSFAFFLRCGGSEFFETYGLVCILNRHAYGRRGNHIHIREILTIILPSLPCVRAFLVRILFKHNLGIAVIRIYCWDLFGLSVLFEGACHGHFRHGGEVLSSGALHG